MLTAFDVGAGVLVLISAILATARGLTREVLSLATWAGAAAFAAYMYFQQKELARQYIAEELVADIATVVVSFILALIILHLITMRIADFVVDSKVGPLDRTLGFLFGALRGILIAVVLVVFGQWLLGNSLPPWAAESKSLPMFDSLGRSLIAALPPNLEEEVTKILRRGGGDDETPADETTGGATEGTEEGTDETEDGSPPTTPADQPV